MKLQLINKINVVPTTPFAFDATFHKPDHFTSNDNVWKPGIRWQSWNWKNTHLGLKFVNKGTIDKALIEIQVFSKNKAPKQFIASLIEEIKYLYNLKLDLSDFYARFKKDLVLGPIIKRWRGMRPGHPSSLYEYLIIGIILQNATVRRSIQMFEALLKKYGTRLHFDNKELWSFWSPGKLQSITEQDLRNLKVGYRAKSIMKIDGFFAAGKIDEYGLRKKGRKTQQEELLKLYGVGPATVWYLLFDIFHHWDYFNHISPWEQKIYSKLFFNQDPENPIAVEKLLEYINRYKPYQQLAVHYIWEDLWWKRKNNKIPWLERLIRI